MAKKTIAEKLRDAPRLDHSFLSPNGRMSKAARNRALEKTFGGENAITLQDIYEERLAAIQPSKVETLERQAKRCRDHAAGGMRPGANLKMAVEIEAEIKRLKDAEQ